MNLIIGNTYWFIGTATDSTLFTQVKGVQFMDEGKLVSNGRLGCTFVTKSGNNFLVLQSQVYATSCEALLGILSLESTEVH